MMMADNSKQPGHDTGQQDPQNGEVAQQGCGYPQQASQVHQSGVVPPPPATCAPQSDLIIPPQGCGYPQQGLQLHHGGLPLPPPPPGGYSGPQFGFMLPQGGGGYPQELQQLQQSESSPPRAGSSSGLSADPDDEHNKTGATECRFTENAIRLGFIRKVYGILLAQLLITVGFIALFALLISNADVKRWVLMKNAYLLLGASGVTLAIMVVLARFPKMRRKAPRNFICLGVLTITEGMLMGTLSITYDSAKVAVLLAIGITGAVLLALTGFACFQTKHDFSTMGGVVTVILIVFLLSGLFLLFVRPIYHIVYAGVGALIFCLYLVYDTQRMMGGKHEDSIEPEEYNFAALNLHVDIINIVIGCLPIPDEIKKFTKSTK